MTRGLIIRTAFILAALHPSAYAQGGCEVSGISGLWPDDKGGWSGSSRMEWLDCADGNSYTASCTHQGSGTTMGACVCQINDNEGFESNCEGLIATPDLGEASRQCCGFKVDAPSGLDDRA